MNLLHLTIHKKGKLAGITSINTSSLQNEFCNSIGCRNIKRKDREYRSVCELCYAEKNEKVRKNLEKCLINNSDILSKELLNDRQVPILNQKYVRFHSFGELINDIHFQNFLKIAKLNPETTFSLMTKRYDIVMKYPKLDNIIYIASSPLINKPVSDINVLKYFDKVFTVYSNDNIGITCGAKDCMHCLKCYSKSGEKSINELLRK